MPYIRSKEWARIQNELSRATSEKSSAPDFTDLKKAIKEDLVRFGANDVANAMIRHPVVRRCRESAFVMETGETVKTQPFRLTDGTFFVLSRPVIERIVQETKIDALDWSADVSDCEDICLRFNSRCLELGLNSCGRVLSWSGRHCFVVFISRNEGGELDLLFFEPQTDRFVEPGEGMYNMENALILIN